MKRTATLCIAALAGILACAALPAAAAADPGGTVTFGASVTNANGTLSTKLTWSTSPAAASCIASGHAAWTGEKGPSGSLDLPTITLSGTYPLLLACSWPGDAGAVLSWTAPTLNTDGTALTNLAGFKIYKGGPTGALTLDRTINSPTTLTSTYTGLPAGQNCFELTAFTTPGIESAHTTRGCKTNTTGTTQQGSVALTVNPVPNAPKGANGTDAAVTVQ
jgi:hypothetical protein